MKSVLISIRPKWVEKICHKIGKDTNRNPIYEKPIEVRKSKPSEVPFRGLIYATKPKEWYKCGAVCVSDESLWLANGKVEMCDGLKFWGDSVEDYQCLNGKVIGEFICDEVYEWKYDYCDGVDIDDDLILDTCIDREDINIYAKGKTLYGWHISDLKIYDNPKELREFLACNGNCNHCKHRVVNPNDVGDVRCENEVNRPPQSWKYVEEV